MDRRDHALSYFLENQTKCIAELMEFIRIPSVSTDPDCVEDIQKAADFLSKKLTSLGMENVQVFPTGKHPIVYGDFLKAGTNQPTILIYGHYDVQPVDPIDLWNSEPFKPSIIGNSLVARGSSDMKGQIFACLSALESVINTDTIPVNIKFLFEGEEEIGSPSLKGFLIAHKELLKADVALNPDAGMLNKNQPTITYGLRGLSYFEVRVFGPNRDLHSGSYGGVVHNPAQVLAELISKMHDSSGKVTLPGFYDGVKELTKKERQDLNRYGESESYYCQQTGVSELWGEDKFSPIERISVRPTLEINGLISGFTGHGAKTIIPARAMAKISTRLVPYQNPESIYKMLVTFMESNAPNSVKWEVEQLSTGSPSISDVSLLETMALHQGLSIVWGVEPIYKREGGSVPVVADMQEILGFDSVLTGFGLPDDNIHSPNEKLDLPTWSKGVQALIHFFYNAAKE